MSKRREIFGFSKVYFEAELIIFYGSYYANKNGIRKQVLKSVFTNILALVVAYYNRMTTVAATVHVSTNYPTATTPPALLIFITITCLLTFKMLLQQKTNTILVETFKNKSNNVLLYIFLLII